MMAANRTEFAQPGRDNGLIFDWRVRRTPPFAKLGMFAVAAGVFLLPWMVLRVQVGAPPVQEARSTSMMLLTPGNDPMHWIEAARDLGPFPTRFAPADWPPSKALLGDVLDAVRDDGTPAHVPGFEELPEPAGPPPVPLVAKGSRVMPAVPPPDIRPKVAAATRPTPRLYLLSSRADELPDASPPFAAEVTPEMAFEPWRFLLQVAPDGSVRGAIALLGHHAPGQPDLTRWLEAHRFPARDGPDDRWVAVAVTFQNPPADGPHDH